MEINIFDSGEVPQPKDDIRIEDVSITSYPDRFRVLVKIRVTPFRDRPNLLLIAYDDDDGIVSELNVIETMHHDMEFTMHMRGVDDPAGTYALVVELFYETRDPPQDRRVEGFVIPDAGVE